MDRGKQMTDFTFYGNDTKQFNNGDILTATVSYQGDYGGRKNKNQDQQSSCYKKDMSLGRYSKTSDNPCRTGSRHCSQAPQPMTAGHN